jgi:hypothetical protein
MAVTGHHARRAIHHSRLDFCYRSKAERYLGSDGAAFFLTAPDFRVL